MRRTRTRPGRLLLFHVQPPPPAGPPHTPPAPIPGPNDFHNRAQVDSCRSCQRRAMGDPPRRRGGGCVFVGARVESGPRFGASDADGMSVRMTLDVRDSGRGLEIRKIVRIVSRHASPRGSNVILTDNRGYCAVCRAAADMVERERWGCRSCSDFAFRQKRRWRLFAGRGTGLVGGTPGPGTVGMAPVPDSRARKCRAPVGLLRHAGLYLAHPHVGVWQYSVFEFS